MVASTSSLGKFPVTTECVVGKSLVLTGFLEKKTFLDFHKVIVWDEGRLCSESVHIKY